MSVFREASVEFKGEDYVFTPSNKMLRRIEAGLAPNTLYGTLSQMQQGQVPLPSLAYILWEFLREAGARVDEDEVFGELSRMLMTGDQNAVLPVVELIAACVTPNAALEKPLASGTTAAKPGATKRKKGPARK